MKGRRPPLRTCPLCGGDHYAWQEDALCKRCRPELDSGFVDVVREQRAERKQARDERTVLAEIEDTFGVKPAGVPYNEFPPGF